MTKLYTVRVSYDYVVVADNVHEAHIVGCDHIRDALGDMPREDVDMDVIEGVHAYGWDGDCIPYGGDGNTRTKDYQNATKSEPSTSS